MKIAEKPKAERTPLGTRAKGPTGDLHPHQQGGAEGWTPKPRGPRAARALHQAGALEDAAPRHSLVPHWPSLTLDHVRGHDLHPIADAMAAVDLHQTLGSADAVEHHFILGKHPSAVEAMEQAPGMLAQMTRQVLAGAPLTEGDLKATFGQHAAYVNGELARALPGRVHSPLSRLVLEHYFTNNLQVSRPQPGERRSPIELLASNLEAALTSPEADGPALTDWFARAGKKGLLDVPALHSEAGVGANYPSVLAGRTTIEFAEALSHGDPAGGRALIKDTFERPAGDLAVLQRDRRGACSLLARFASVAFHQAWRVSKLHAAAAEPDATKAADVLAHEDMVPVRTLMLANQGTRAAVSAAKIGDQVLASIGRSGGIDFMGLEMSRGLSLRTRLTEIAERGPHDRDGNITPAALGVSHWIGESMRVARRVTDYRVAAREAQDVVSDSAAAFTAAATGRGDAPARERLHAFYDDLLERFQPMLEKLHHEDKLSPDEKQYRQLYQDFSGRFSLDAMTKALGAANTQALVRSARVADLIPLAAASLKLPVPKGYSAKSVARDIEDLSHSLLANDYFLKAGPDGAESRTLATLKREATAPATAALDRASLEMAVRGPNAAWMWLLLIRGLAEDDPRRLRGGEADLNSDAFPDHVQFNAPEVRDTQLFNWARDRLSARQPPLSPQRIQELALSLVVFTQYKDLLQLRKAAQVEV